MEELIDYNQFKESRLQPMVMNVVRCGSDESFKIGKKLCNILSTCAILRDLKIYKEDYETFYKTCLIKNYCDKYGYFFIDKIDTENGKGLLSLMDLPVTIKKYDSIPEDLDFNQRFQIAINNKHHFMAAKSMNDNKNIFLYDTNDRPFGAELMEALKDTDRITWFKRYEI